MSISSDDITQIMIDNELLTGLNSNWRSYFQDLADFCLPRKAWITSIKSKGETLKFNFLYDTTAIRSLRTMASGFHTNLTNPHTKWFGLYSRDLRLMKIKEVESWFFDVRDEMISVLNNSNYDPVQQESYMNSGCFGTSVDYSEENFENTINFKEIPIEQVNLEEDASGVVIAVYRNFRLTAIQAYMLWGLNAGKSVVESFYKRPYVEFEFLHYVGKRNRRDVGKSDRLNLPFQSVWIAKKEKHLINESGYEEFPYAISRFYKDTSDAFGFSPAMDALAEIKGINTYKKTFLRSVMKQADPPYDAPSKGYLLPLNMNPAAMNYRDPKLTQDQLLRQLPVGSNVQFTAEYIDMSKREIEDHFFVPLFRSLSDVTKHMTVPEVQRRINESMGLLGPAIGRITKEGITPKIMRLFKMMYRNGKFPNPPDVLLGQEMDIAFLSPLARAQKESEMIPIESFLGIVSQISQVKPESLDKIDEDKTIDIIAQIKGINPDILRDPKQIKMIRENRQKAMEMQQQMMAMQQGSQIAKTGAEADQKFVQADNER